MNSVANKNATIKHKPITKKFFCELALKQNTRNQERIPSIYRWFGFKTNPTSTLTEHTQRIQYEKQVTHSRINLDLKSLCAKLQTLKTLGTFLKTSLSESLTSHGTNYTQVTQLLFSLILFNLNNNQVHIYALKSNFDSDQ